MAWKFYRFSSARRCVAPVTIYKGEYKQELDHFGSFLGMPSSLGVVWVIAPAFGLSLIFHPSLNSNFFTDVAWTFALALESRPFPQVFMFVRFMKAGLNIGALDIPHCGRPGPGKADSSFVLDLSSRSLMTV